MVWPVPAARRATPHSTSRATVRSIAFVVRSSESRSTHSAREVIGPDFIASGIIPDSLLSDRLVSEVLLPHAVRAARLTSSDAFGFGVTNELCSTADYPVSQRWASAFHRDRFDGIWYQPRFSPGSGRALAVFGPSRPRDESALTQTPFATVIRTMPGLTIARTHDRRESEVLDEPRGSSA